MSQGLSPKSEEKKKTFFPQTRAANIEAFRTPFHHSWILATVPKSVVPGWFDDGNPTTLQVRNFVGSLLGVALQLVQGNQVPVAYSICHKWVNYAYNNDDASKFLYKPRYSFNPP